ncbi:MAG: transcription elongation factor GreA [Candidatus Cloacimonetes bacterium]|nr:transcription elongation factor GreA [Candidatus Cloacimonadota bacterium]
MSDYITKEGMQRLQKKVQTLQEERPKVLEQIQAARELGDLSENAEYHAARERQRNIDNELNTLNSKLMTLKVIDPDTLPKDTVRFGAYVQLEETTSGEIFKYRLVGVDEVYDRDDGILQTSTASPLGKSMLAKKCGEEFIVKAPKGDRYFKVLTIE